MINLFAFSKLSFSRSFKLLFILFLLSGSVHADTGCLVNNKIYTDYLGNASPYHPSNPEKKYYSSIGNRVEIYYGAANDGYHCGFVNIYPASNYWDGRQNVSIEGQNEISSRERGGCVISATLGGTPEGGDGELVTFNMNNSTYCSRPPVNNLPLDDHIGVIVLAAGIIGACFISKRGKFAF